MPRAYTKSEREKIVSRLKESGKFHFVQNGLRKTTIDDLIRDIAIGKGTFYEFFDSKEDLFMAILEQIESASRQQLQVLADEFDGNPKTLQTFFRAICDHLKHEPFLQVLTKREELEHLMRHADSKRMDSHQADDGQWFRQVFKRWKRKKLVTSGTPDQFFGMVTTLFILFQNREAFGDSFDATIELVIQSVSDQFAAN